MSMTIQAAARSLGVSAHTLRFYEQAGLLETIERDENGYRRYQAADLEWLRFLLCLRGTGMSVSEMAKYAALAQSGDQTRDERREILESHAARVEQEMRELGEHLDMIRYKISHYDRIAQFRPGVTREDADRLVAAR